MARTKDTPPLAALEEAVTVPFCLVDDAYAYLNPKGARRYEGLKKLSDSEVLALALLQQLRGVESQRSFLRDAARFFPHLFAGVLGLAHSSFHRRARRLLGDLAYRSGALGEEMAERGILLASGRVGARRSGSRSRCASRPSSAPSVSARRPRRRRWWGWRSGSRPRSRPTPTVAT